MQLKIEKPEEVFVAVAATTICVDQVGTLDERRFLFDKVRKLDVFDSYEDSQFSALVNQITEMVAGSLITEECTISDEGLKWLCDHARALLEDQELKLLFEMAVDLGSSDALQSGEKSFLEQLKVGLGINDQ